jgi:hypothetical protein
MVTGRVGQSCADACVAAATASTAMKNLVVDIQFPPALVLIGDNAIHARICLGAF